MSEQPQEVRTAIHPYSEIAAAHVEWLIPGIVPAGMLTVLAGEQGLGKSMLHARWAADLSRQGKPAILVSAEDAPAYTTKPRLMAAQADENLVYHFDIERSFGTEDDLSIDLSAAIQQSGAKLLVLDPLSALLGQYVDSHKDQDVRRVLAALASIAESTGCAIVYVMHLTKGVGQNPMQRIAGSIAFTAAARSVLLMVPENNDALSTVRLVAHVKCNVSEKAQTQRWEIRKILLPEVGGRDIETARLDFLGFVDIAMDALLAPRESAEERSALDHAKEIICSRLASGEIPSGDLEGYVLGVGISEITYKRARRELGVEVRKDGERNRWLSYLEASVESVTKQGDHQGDQGTPMIPLLLAQPGGENDETGARGSSGPLRGSDDPLALPGVSQSLEPGSPEWYARATFKQMREWESRLDIG